MTEIELYDYQKQAKQFVIDHPYCGLFMDMGTGKTRITLAALQDIQPTGHILVIAPINIARSTWLDEIKLLGLNIRTKSLIVNERGKKLTKQKRLERYAEIPTDPPTMYFINRDLVKDLVMNMPKVKNTPIWYFPTVVIDEYQSFKSYKSDRFKYLKYVRPAISRLIGLTGTPTPNGLEDLWAEIYLLDMGIRLEPTITAYRNKYFDPGRYANGYPIEYIEKDGAEPVIYDKIKDIVISMKSTTLKLPERIYNNEYVYMDIEEEKAYKEMMKKQVLPINEEITVEAANAAVKTAKLMQMASGTLYINEKHDYIILHKKKLERCHYLIENTDGPVLIAYFFKSDKEMLLHEFPNAIAFDGSPEMIHDWNDKKIPILLIHPASAGHGLNLQFGGNTLIWYTVPWTLEYYLQCNKRLHRPGQTRPVTIHHILTRKTIDERILYVINQKDHREQALLDAVEMTIQDALSE